MILEKSLYNNCILDSDIIGENSDSMDFTVKDKKSYKALQYRFERLMNDFSENRPMTEKEGKLCDRLAIKNSAMENKISQNFKMVKIFHKIANINTVCNAMLLISMVTKGLNVIPPVQAAQASFIMCGIAITNVAAQGLTIARNKHLRTTIKHNSDILDDISDKHNVYINTAEKLASMNAALSEYEKNNPRMNRQKRPVMQIAGVYNMIV